MNHLAAFHVKVELSSARISQSLLSYRSNIQQRNPEFCLPFWAGCLHFVHPGHWLHITEQTTALPCLESLKLEKTSNIKSNRQPNTTMPTKKCPEVPRLHVFLTPPVIVTPPLPWAAC